MVAERPFRVDIGSVDYMVLAHRVAQTDDSIVVAYFLVVDSSVDSLVVVAFVDAVAI